jgi:hypothetical protein
MPGLALFIAWNQAATSAALLGMALVARASIAAADYTSFRECGSVGRAADLPLLPNSHVVRGSRENLSYTSGQRLSFVHRSAGGQLANVHPMRRVM